MTKRYKKTAVETKPTIESVLDDSIATLELGLRHLRAEIGLIAAGKAKKSKYDPASRIAFLSGGVGRIVDSLRKIESARAKRFDELTQALVMAWLRQLDSTERINFLREASQIDARKSGLA
jgi:hypothetical protein